MSANSNSQRRAPPLAGRPPFATDEDDAVYDNAAPRTRRQQPPKSAQGGGRDSMYQAWENYLHTDNRNSRPNSGAGGIGMGLMAGELDDSDDDDQPPVKKGQGAVKTTAATKPSNLRPPPSEKPRVSNETQRTGPYAPQGQQPVARPQPAAMAGPPAANRQGSYDRPQRHPQQQQQQQQQQAQPVPRAGGVQRPAAAALRVDVPQPAMPIPRAPIPTFMQSPSPSPSPSIMPHPLNAPSTPITPVFARPSFQGSSSDKKVEFAVRDIMRGNSEETLLSRNTPKGEEFWRRFSYVAKEEPKRKKSKWLRSTLGGSRTMSRLVWCLSILLLAAIGGGIGFGWYMTHNNAPTIPVAVGGSANESQVSTSVRSTTTTSSTSHGLIAPTLASRRGLADDDGPYPTPTPTAFVRRSHLRGRDNRLNRLD